MEPMFVVVADWAATENGSREGAVINQKMASALLPTKELELLPVVPELVKATGAGGYVIRKAPGTSLAMQMAKMVFPITILVPEGPWRRLNWLARLRPTEAVAERAAAGEKVSDGVLRLVADNSQAYAQRFGFTPTTEATQGAALGKTDERGGWTIGGAGNLSLPMAGHIGLALYGALPNVMVDWLAVSVGPLA